METLYKYSGLMNMDFFDNPTIKISIPANLNDPFEREPSNNIRKAIEINAGVSETDGHMESIEYMIQNNGIVSLSETPRNSLMWAHYGNNHKGMCIGLKKTFLNEKTIYLNAKEQNFTVYHQPILIPRKVNYDNYRFDIQKKMSKNSLIKESFISHFYTKSDEWIYEKEHRCIVPYVYASHILVGDPNESITFNHENKKNKAFLSSGIEQTLKSGGLTKTKTKNLYKITEDNKSMLLLSNFSEFSSVSFLSEIEPSSIESIYFGARVAKEKIHSIFNKIKTETHPLRHVNLYSFSLSKVRFELKCENVDDDFFKNNPFI